MSEYGRLMTLIACAVVTLLYLQGCGKKEEARIIVTKQDFSIRHDGKNSYSLDVTGKVKNAGKMDAKQIVLTGYCRSCDEIVRQGHWFVNDLEKTPIQQDTISYLPAGSEKEFSFKEVAYYWANAGEEPEKIPEDIDIIIKSVEPVD